MGFLLGLALSTGLGIYSALQQGRAATAAADYNARAQEAEAANLATEAAMRERDFAENVRRERVNQTRSLSALRARLAGSGVQTTTGNSLQIVADTASGYQLAVSDAARNQYLEHRRAVIAGNSLRAQAAMTRFNGRQAQTASILGAIGTGMQGGVKLSGNAYENKYLGLSPFA